MASRFFAVTQDAPDVRARLRLLRIGAWPGAFACCVALIYVALTWAEPNRSAIVFFAVAPLTFSLGIAFVPLEAVVRSRWSELFFLGWSAGMIASVTVCAAFDGGAASPLVVGLFMPLAFAALSYPPASTIVVAALIVLAFLGLASSGGADLPSVVVFTCVLVGTAWISAWQALSLQRQREELARVSRSDPLTGALNRRGFEERFAAALSRARRDEGSFSLVLLDLDRFKLVNDAQGHAAGDALLCWVVDRLHGQLRASDRLGRLGGDEFALLLDGPDSAARATLARLLDLLAERTGVSAGVAGFPQDGVDADAMHQVADAELYVHKREGEPRRPAHR